MEQNISINSKKKYFICGILGSGCAAVAHILLDKGHEVIGSDVDSYVFTQDELIKRGVKIYRFGEYDMNDVDVVIAGHDFYPFSIDVKRALRLGKSVIEYHSFLSTLVNSKYSIAVCGSHGKTSSVGLLCELLKEYNPSYLRGDGVGKWTDSNYFVFEACEYKNHFHIYRPNEIIVLNIDYDHTDFFKTFDEYKNSFIKFIKYAKNKVYVLDNLTYLKGKNVHYFGDNSFTLVNENTLMYNKKRINNISFNVHQKELINNQLGCILCALNLGVSPSSIRKNLKSFSGVKRRYQEKIIKDDIFIDDYAHHPSQMKVMINEVRLKYPTKKIVTIFKPDRYSRILKFHKEIKDVLSTADEFYVLPFPSNMKNDTNESFTSSIISNELDEKSIIEKVKDYSNCVYLFFSSKDLSSLINSLINRKFDIK